MPIAKDRDGKWFVFCVNGCEKEEANATKVVSGTTMNRDPSTYAMFEVKLLDGSYEGNFPRCPARVVHVLTCQACGSVELYDVTVNKE